jgi:hypothetical protein
VSAGLTETEERYEVWVEDEGGKRRTAGHESWPEQNLEFVEGLVREYNIEEYANARTELRERRRRFFLVRVTLTRREIGL